VVADCFKALEGRLTPAAAIPVHTPQEAVEELEFGVKQLGAKVCMFGSGVRYSQRCRLGHAPCATRKPAPIARKRDQRLVGTLATAQPDETLRQDAAFEKSIDLILDRCNGGLNGGPGSAPKGKHRSFSRLVRSGPFVGPLRRLRRRASSVEAIPVVYFVGVLPWVRGRIGLSQAAAGRGQRH